MLLSYRQIHRRRLCVLRVCYVAVSAVMMQMYVLRSLFIDIMHWQTFHLFWHCWLGWRASSSWNFCFKTPWDGI